MKLLHVYHHLLLYPTGTSLCTVWKGPPKAQQTNRVEQQLSDSRTALEVAISSDPGADTAASGGTLAVAGVEGRQRHSAEALIAHCSTHRGKVAGRAARIPAVARGGGLAVADARQACVAGASRAAARRGPTGLQHR
jgi:hypothetical protein